MRSKIKTKFRICVLCLIAMFVLLPLLSSPVAAQFKSPFWAYTTNGPGGIPSVS